MTRNVTGLALFPIVIDVAIAEFLAVRNLVFVMGFLVFVDLILLVSINSAVSRRDRRYSSIRKGLIPLAEPEIVETARIILAKFGISQADIYLTKSDSFRGPPALTVGISRPSLWFSDRMLKELSPSEVGEIIGHELAHLVKRHRIKILLIGLLYTLTGIDLAVFTTSRILPAPALFPVAGLALTFASYTLVVPYARREFEFDADEIAARVLGNPDELASALLKVNGMLSRPSNLDTSGWRKWTASHPPISERVSKLRQLPRRNSP